MSVREEASEINGALRMTKMEKRTMKRRRRTSTRRTRMRWRVMSRRRNRSSMKTSTMKYEDEDKEGGEGLA